MVRKIICLSVLSAVLLSASGCGGSSDSVRQLPEGEEKKVREDYYKKQQERMQKTQKKTR